MTRVHALKNLNLPPDASPEAVEAAYRRMVHRYPPEFHPERFRIIDESYRFLTSPAFLVKTLLCTEDGPSDLDPGLFDFSPSLPENALDEALVEMQRGALMQTLWGPEPE